MITTSAFETEKLGEKVAKKVKKGGMIALYGELGSGKTTFARGLARALGIKKRIVSPTFIFIRPYEIPRYGTRAKGTPKSFATGQAPRTVARRSQTRLGRLTSRKDSSEVEELASAKFFYHIDLYRVGRFKDTRGLGLEEILSEPENIVVIEWAEKIKQILPQKRIDIWFKYLTENKREVLLDMKIDMKNHFSFTF